MAEQQTPTFKLVLVGDGGTGKVCNRKAFDVVRETLSAVAQQLPA